VEDPREDPGEDGERKKTATRSFRVDESALEAIEKDAAEAKVSVNTFVNQLFLSYTDFDRYFIKSQRNPLLSDLVGYLIESLSDEAAAEAGKRVGQNVLRSIILAKYGSMSLGSLLASIRLFAEYGKAYSIYETVTAGRRTMTLVHSWGKKGSIYLAQIAATGFEMIGLESKITTTEKTVTITI
jgi:hypothetical protein